MSIQDEIAKLLEKYPKKNVYLDYAATSYMDPLVKEAMNPYFTEIFANPGGFYEIGQKAKDAVDAARESIAGHLNCSPGEIIFTGSGTESDNMAIFGIARKYGKALSELNPDEVNLSNVNRGESNPGESNFAGKTRGHIITTSIEHHAVEMPCKQLKKEGFEITFLPVNKYGQVKTENIKAALRDDTILVSVMMANNEIGTIQPIAEIGALLKEHKAFFHTDACQAAGVLNLDVEKLGVDLMTINGSKIYGPKGIGALYLRKGVRISPIIYGGGQEKGLRGGTENVPYIVGFAKALDLAQKDKEKENARLTTLRDKLIHGLQDKLEKVILNGPPEKRLPNNANLSVLDLEGEAFTLFLNEFGIYAATGSACTSQTLDPSHVIIATGMPYECAHGSIRFTLGRKTTEEEIDFVLEVVPKIVEILREISPLNLDEKSILEKGRGELNYI